MAQYELDGTTNLSEEELELIHGGQTLVPGATPHAPRGPSPSEQLLNFVNTYGPAGGNTTVGQMMFGVASDILASMVSGNGGNPDAGAAADATVPSPDATVPDPTPAPDETGGGFTGDADGAGFTGFSGGAS